MDITEEPWPAFLKEMTEGRLGLYMVGWIEDFHDPHDWVTPYQGSNGAWSGTQHFPKDLQAKFDDQITKAAQATDNAERVKMYKELQNEAYENAIDIFLEQPQNRRYQQLWVKGWYYNPTYFGGLGTGAYIYALSKEK
jgi:peptide/nickel transport system substrate-binding protein